MSNRKRFIVGISGASGVVHAITLLEALKACGCESHLVMSKSAKLTLSQEMGLTADDVIGLADYHYATGDIGARIASGSYVVDGMFVVPCSVRTMSAIATGVTDNLLTRAADVTLKEGRKLILAVREAPLHVGHLRTMTQLAEMGAVIAPPMPAFYTKPQSIDDLVVHVVGRLLDLVSVDNVLTKRWQGLQAVKDVV